MVDLMYAYPKRDLRSAFDYALRYGRDAWCEIPINSRKYARLFREYGSQTVFAIISDDRQDVESITKEDLLNWFEDIDELQETDREAYLAFDFTNFYGLKMLNSEDSTLDHTNGGVVFFPDHISTIVSGNTDIHTVDDLTEYSIGDTSKLWYTTIYDRKYCTMLDVVKYSSFSF